MTIAVQHSRMLIRLFPAALLAAMALLYAFVLDGPTRLVAYPAGRDSAEAPGIVVAFRNDDLTVTSDAALESRILRLFAQRGIPQTFAFIPRPEQYLGIGHAVAGRPAIVDSLRVWHAAGLVEFALHGVTHVRHPGSGGEFDRVAPGRQMTIVAEGKRIADSVLGVPVRIFAPPWNQADVHTLSACRESGIQVFSGYMGTEPVEGIMQVNTNAVLFAGSTGLPEAATVLQALRKGSGVRYLCIFYHSRADFADSAAVARLAGLLQDLTSDPDVRFSSLGGIAAAGTLSSRQYTAAGIAIRQAEEAMDRAKLARMLGGLWTLLGLDVRGAEALLGRSMDAYWRGEYQTALSVAGDFARQADRVRLAGRGLVALAGMLGAIASFWFMPPAWVRRWMLVLVISTGIAVVVVQNRAIMSANLTGELTVMAILVLAAVLLAGQLVALRRTAEGGTAV